MYYRNTGKNLFCDVYYYLRHFNNYLQFVSYKYVFHKWECQLFTQFTLVLGLGGKLSRLVYLAPPLQPRISERMDNQQSANFITPCTTGIFSWKGYKRFFSQSEMLTSNVQLGYVLGGSKLVYLASRPEFWREWIISKFYYIIDFRNI